METKKKEQNTKAEAETFAATVKGMNRDDQLMFSLMSPLDAVDITLRGAIQTIDTNNHRDDVGVRVVERGQFKKFTPGTMQQGKAMDATLTLETTYILVEYDGKEKLLLNKLTGEYRVNGVDIMSKVRSLT